MRLVFETEVERDVERSRIDSGALVQVVCRPQLSLDVHPSFSRTQAGQSSGGSQSAGSAPWACPYALSQSS